MWKFQDVGVRMLGVMVRMTSEEMSPLRAINSLLFQGSEAETGLCM
jgi:hypothetical protein